MWDWVKAQQIKLHDDFLRVSCTATYRKCYIYLTEANANNRLKNKNAARIKGLLAFTCCLAILEIHSYLLANQNAYMVLLSQEGSELENYYYLLANQSALTEYHCKWKKIN